MRSVLLSLFTAAVLAQGAPAQAHELEADRLTLVLRQSQHVSLRFQLDPIGLLQRTLSPHADSPQVLMQLVSLSPEDFKALWMRSQARVEEGIRLSPLSGRGSSPHQWRWPTTSEVQSLLQQRAAQQVIAPHEHAQTATIEVLAEWLAPAHVSSLDLRLPPELPRLLVVHYQPQQTWSRASDAPTRLRF